mmetsp:Transcript_18019/g.32266  ORF Transcript_18019/g.32266 Transcript_18019/m.32266 type:complete len:240 (-) Transcript_18019:1681-2400(-)
MDPDSDPDPHSCWFVSTGFVFLLKTGISSLPFVPSITKRSSFTAEAKLNTQQPGAPPDPTTKPLSSLSASSPLLPLPPIEPPARNVMVTHVSAEPWFTPARRTASPEARDIGPSKNSIKSNTTAPCSKNSPPPAISGLSRQPPSPAGTTANARRDNLYVTEVMVPRSLFCFSTSFTALTLWSQRTWLATNRGTPAAANASRMALASWYERAMGVSSRHGFSALHASRASARRGPGGVAM